MAEMVCLIGFVFILLNWTPTERGKWRRLLSKWLCSNLKSHTRRIRAEHHQVQSHAKVSRTKKCYCIWAPYLFSMEREEVCLSPMQGILGMQGIRSWALLNYMEIKASSSLSNQSRCSSLLCCIHVYPLVLCISGRIRKEYLKLCFYQKPQRRAAA